MSTSTCQRAKTIRVVALLCGWIGVAVSVPVSGCTAPHTKEDNDSTPPVQVFTSADNGKKVAVTEGIFFEVSLEANASTGYQWNIATQDKEALESEGEPQFVRPKGAAPGTPSQQVFRFKAKKPSTTKLVFHYARPWEKDKKPAETFSLQVTVNKAQE